MNAQWRAAGVGGGAQRVGVDNARGIGTRVYRRLGRKTLAAAREGGGRGICAGVARTVRARIRPVDVQGWVVGVGAR